jgi:undecaprenyl-diphosphatase
MTAPAPARLALALASVVLFAWVASEVTTGRALALDNELRTTVHANLSPALAPGMRFVTGFGKALTLWILCSAAVVAMLASGARRAAVVFTVVMAGGALLDTALKLAFLRPRPPVSFYSTPFPDPYSFPSGHALLSMCFFATLAALASPRVTRPALCAAMWIAAAAVIFVIGFSRIYLGVHYPSDVLGGYAVAAAWVSATGFLRE